jgi:aldehyde dehydrogenase (NAD+)
MGAESGLPFNTAIRCFKRDGLQTPLSPDVLPAMVTVSMPLPISQPALERIALPPWETCLRLVTKYFEDVHCLYWLYSSERFHSQLEETYHVSQEMLTASWRCSLCSILAIAKLGSTDPDDSNESVTAKDYLESAKSFVYGACDEGSLESVRSMVLLVSAS